MKPQIPPLTDMNLQEWKDKTMEEKLQLINDYWDSRHKEIDLTRSKPRKARKGQKP